MVPLTAERLRWEHHEGLEGGYCASEGELRAHIWFVKAQPKENAPWAWSVSISRGPGLSFHRHGAGWSRQEAADAANDARPAVTAEAAAADVRATALERIVESAIKGEVVAIPIDGKDESFHRDAMWLATHHRKGASAEEAAPGLLAFQAALSAYFFERRTQQH